MIPYLMSADGKEIILSGLILSRSGKLPVNAAVFNVAGRTIVFTGEKDKNFPGSETVLLNEAETPAHQIC